MRALVQWLTLPFVRSLFAIRKSRQLSRPTVQAAHGKSLSQMLKELR